MSTIPASAIVQVLPGVINAGGAAIVMNGIMLSQSWRVPAGTVMQFASPTAVGNYFGFTSTEYLQSVIYFAGHNGSSQKPGNLLVAQYNQTAVAAIMLGGKVSTLTIAQLQALTGSLTLTIDNYPRVIASLNLSSATSYTAAATLIQNAVNTAEPTEASVTGSIAASTAAFVASFANDIMTVTTLTSGTIVAGAVLTGGGVVAGTQVAQQLSGTTGGVGTYAVSIPQTTVINNASITATYGTLTVSAVSSGTLSVGQTITGGTTAAGTIITQLGTGTGLTGTYFVNLTQTVVSGALTATASNITVTYDSQSGGFIITSGITGAASTIAYATGTLSGSLFLTAQTGAVLSQGLGAQTPSAFMNSIINATQNWASFWLNFDPDGGNGNAQKLAFAAWTNSQNNRYAFICWDADTTPTTIVPATTSLGYLIGLNVNNYSGTHLIYDPQNTGQAAFMAGYIASLNFGAINGRTTAAFRSQTGLPATVSTQQIAANLIANGYNYYGAYATANQNFIFSYNGSISGPFQWLDSYVNQIWMNSQFQLALLNLLVSVNSIPYNDAGNQMIINSCMTTINAALNFGAIRTGIPLSSTQVIQVNNASGLQIDGILSTRGWYFQVQPSSPQTRQARQTPPCFFWYMDGQSVQQITLNSIELM